jgi:hypothetical protein
LRPGTGDGDRQQCETGQSSQFTHRSSPHLLNSAGIPFTRPDSDHLDEIEYEYFSIPHFSGLSRLHDGLDHLIDQRIIDRNFYLCLRYELDGVLSASIDLGMPATPCTPTSLTALRTSSSLNGLMIAVTSFIPSVPAIGVAAWAARGQAPVVPSRKIRLRSAG